MKSTLFEHCILPGHPPFFVSAISLERPAFCLHWNSSQCFQTGYVACHPLVPEIKYKKLEKKVNVSALNLGWGFKVSFEYIDSTRICLVEL